MEIGWGTIAASKRKRDSLATRAGHLFLPHSSVALAVYENESKGRGKD